MAVGFAQKLVIWEVELGGMYISRFVDEESADEYIRQIREEAKSNILLSTFIGSLHKYTVSVTRFVGELTPLQEKMR